MGLRFKFNLALIVTTLVGLGISAAVSEIRPLLKVQQRRNFISQTVPAYAASRYIKQLQATHEEYSYKEATLNPTNPANRAAEWEADIVS